MKKIVFYPDSGLGNRLGNIYSAIYYSELLNHDITIYWESDLHCWCKYYQLFMPMDHVKVHEAEDRGFKGLYGIKSIIARFNRLYYRKNYHYLSSEDGLELYQRAGSDGLKEALMSFNKICIKGRDLIFDTTKVDDDFWQKIQPSKLISDRVEEILFPYQKRRLVGVHIRRTDHITAITNSPLELFIEAMKNECDEEPNTIFYIATDDLATEQQLMTKFDCIPHILFSKEKTRSQTEGILDAWVDMQCLSKCERIYGSSQSSFSQMAARIGGNQLVVLEK